MQGDALFRAFAQGGRRLVGCFPLYPPVEIFHAMDLEPVVLWGLKPFFPDTTRGDRHLQNFVCSVGRHVAECVLSEAGRSLDALFMYNACDTLRNLPEILAAGMRERGRTVPLYHIHIPMIPPQQTDAAGYLEHEITTLIGGLERGFGCTFSRRRFRESAVLYGRARAAAERLERAVADGTMSFGAFAGLLQGNYFRPVEAQIARLESALGALEGPETGVPARPRRGRVLVSGILPPMADVCTLIEDAGLRVVGNDIASLRRTYAYGPDPSLSPQEYYRDFYANHHPCPTLLGSGDARVEAFDALVEERSAEGVIFLGEKFCEYEYFEFPYLTKRLQKRGVHAMVLEFAVDDEQGVAPLKTRIEAFAELMG